MACAVIRAAIVESAIPWWKNTENYCEKFEKVEALHRKAVEQNNAAPPNAAAEWILGENASYLTQIAWCCNEMIIAHNMKTGFRKGLPEQPMTRQRKKADDKFRDYVAYKKAHPELEPYYNPFSAIEKWVKEADNPFNLKAYERKKNEKAQITARSYFRKEIS